MKAIVDKVIGRYVQLELNEDTVRIYYEESGEGTPLLCLHTAGADGRQYREVIRNESVT